MVMAEEQEKASAARKRRRLWPLMLVGANVLLVGMLVWLAWPQIESRLPWLSKGKPTGLAALEPDMLVTPSGRRLDLSEFGGFVFEVTRIAWTSDPRSRRVVITVPGRPPRQGVFRIGDSFAGGEVRVVDISTAGATFECRGEQQTFGVRGATAAEVWDSAGSGPTFLPPRNFENVDLLPNLNTGRTVAPRDPLMAAAGAETPDPSRPHVLGARNHGPSLEDLPLIYSVTLERDEYLALVRSLPLLLEREFVFGLALERETRNPYGLLIKNLAPSSRFYTHGMRPGDVLVSLNGETVLHYDELEALASGNHFREEIVFEVLRDDELVTFQFVRG
jgi:hypothetical protein